MSFARPISALAGHFPDLPLPPFTPTLGLVRRPEAQQGAHKGLSMSRRAVNPKDFEGRR